MHCRILKKWAHEMPMFWYFIQSSPSPPGNDLLLLMDKKLQPPAADGRQDTVAGSSRGVRPRQIKSLCTVKEANYWHCSYCNLVNPRRRLSSRPQRVDEKCWTGPADDTWLILSLLRKQQSLHRNIWTPLSNFQDRFRSFLICTS